MSMTVKFLEYRFRVVDEILGGLWKASASAGRGGELIGLSNGAGLCLEESEKRLNCLAMVFDKELGKRATMACVGSLPYVTSLGYRQQCVEQQVPVNSSTAWYGDEHTSGESPLLDLVSNLDPDDLAVLLQGTALHGGLPIIPEKDEKPLSVEKYAFPESQQLIFPQALRLDAGLDVSAESAKHTIQTPIDSQSDYELSPLDHEVIETICQSVEAIDQSPAAGGSFFDGGCRAQTIKNERCSTTADTKLPGADLQQLFGCCKSWQAPFAMDGQTLSQLTHVEKNGSFAYDRSSPSITNSETGSDYSEDSVDQKGKLHQSTRAYYCKASDSSESSADEYDNNYSSQRSPLQQKDRGREAPKVESIALDKTYEHGSPPPCLQLWLYLLHILELGKQKSDLCWVDREQGLFKVVRQAAVAKSWGDYRAVSSMTYQSMARAMRHYYRRNILEQTNGRLLYKFTRPIMKQVLRYEREHCLRMAR